MVIFPDFGNANFFFFFLFSFFEQLSQLGTICFKFFPFELFLHGMMDPFLLLLFYILAV